MKKIAMLFVVMLTIGTLGFANSKKEEAAKNVSITVQAEAGWVGYYQAAIDRVVAKNPGATIKIIEMPSFDHLDVIDATDVTNPDVADVFALPGDRIYPLSRNEALAPIDAKAIAAKTGGFGDYDNGLGGAFKIDGDYLAFPMNIETLIVFANQANADTYGVDLTKDVEFTSLPAGQMLIPAFNAWFGVAVTNAGDIEMLGKNGDKLFSDLVLDWKDLPAEKKAIFEALYTYWSELDALGTPAWDNSAGWGYMDEQFKPGGSCVLRIEGPWSTGSLTGHAGEDNIRILPINQVKVNGKPLLHWKGGWGVGVNARLEGQDAEMALAQALIAELINPAYAVDFFKASGKIMANVKTSAYLDSNLSKADKVVVEAVLASYKNAPARPLFTEWGQVWGTWENSLLSWSSVKPESPEAAYNLVKASFDAMMANF